MSVEIQQYGHDPVLLVQFIDELSIDSVRQMYAESDALASQMDSPVVWRLIDISTTNATFADVMNLVKGHKTHTPGCFSDSRIRTVFCPSHPMARLLADMLAKPEYGNLDLPVFPGLGEALLFVQEELFNDAANV